MNWVVLLLPGTKLPEGEVSWLLAIVAVVMDRAEKEEPPVNVTAPVADTVPVRVPERLIVPSAETGAT